MFENLSISKNPNFSDNLNQFNVIFLNIQQILSGLKDTKEIVPLIRKKLVEDILKSYPHLNRASAPADLIDVLHDMFAETNIPIVFIIDEWDCIFREDKNNEVIQKLYMDFLTNLLKDRDYVALAYMTGILPIKKYGTHSSLNMFDEFLMTNPGKLAEFVGFTQSEVASLCHVYGMDYVEISAWYNGYSFSKAECVYNPKSVVEALLSQKCRNYWTQTESYEVLSIYFKANFDGLKASVIRLLGGGKKQIHTRNFANDMISFKTCDDILTLFVHLGYLKYDFETKEVSIPNKEIAEEFEAAIRSAGWDEYI